MGHAQKFEKNYLRYSSVGDSNDQSLVFLIILMLYTQPLTHVGHFFCTLQMPTHASIINVKLNFHLS